MEKINIQDISPELKDFILKNEKELDLIAKIGFGHINCPIKDGKLLINKKEIKIE